MTTLLPDVIRSVAPVGAPRLSGQPGRLRTEARNTTRLFPTRPRRRPRLAAAKKKKTTTTTTTTTTGLLQAAGAAGTLLKAASVFLTALGFVNTTRHLLDFQNRVLGAGSAGGGNAGDLAGAMAGYLFFPSEGSLAATCLPCVQACNVAVTKLKVRANASRIAELAVRVTQLMDAALKRHKHQSLVEFLHTKLVSLANSKLATKSWPINWLRLKWLLPASVVAQYDMMRNPRMKLLGWVMTTYVEYYVPHLVGKYDLSTVERALFGRFRPHVVAFLKGRESDISPVIGFLVRHLVAYNNLHIQAHLPTIACSICSSKSMTCSQKTASAAAVALASAAANSMAKATANTRPAKRAAKRAVPVGTHAAYFPRK